MSICTIKNYWQAYCNEYGSQIKCFLAKTDAVTSKVLKMMRRGVKERVVSAEFKPTTVGTQFAELNAPSVAPLLLAAPLLIAAARCGIAAARCALRHCCFLRAAALLRADADCAIASCQIGARIAARCAIAALFCDLGFRGCCVLCVLSALCSLLFSVLSSSASAPAKLIRT